MKKLVINNTDLTNMEVGALIDQVLRDCEVDTLYYGKNHRIWFIHNRTNKRYKLTITYLKRYNKWLFEED